MGGYSDIGLDMGSNRIKLVQLKQVRGRVFLHCCAACPTPEGAIKAGDQRSGSACRSVARVRRDQPWRRNRVNLAPGPAT